MKQFIDTAPFIYFIEDHPDFSDKVYQYLAASLSNNDEFTTSVITLMEFGVKPEKENRQEVISQFEELLVELDIQLLVIDKAIARSAYQLRAKYDFLKAMDAFQLAAAIENQCQLFFTNDKKLKRVTEISVLLVEEL
ncbi:MAG: PIN domain-containing protein [Bacteroidota bacterium]